MKFIIKYNKQINIYKMVQKSKGGKKNRSVQAGKKAKLEMKHHRKKNYKKKILDLTNYF